jgi:mannitol-1-phosphate 5-dehydrogenase
MKFIQYGAGNIGRSLIAQLFSRAGYEVVFIDVDDNIISALNQEKRYLIQVKDEKPEDIWVENVRGVNGKDKEAVIKEIATADIMATAVGANALKYIYEIVAEGIKQRKNPLNIIICENLRHMSQIFKDNLIKYLPEEFPIDERIGFVETTIGKMVPIMPEEVKKRDPLLVWAEAYNTLYVARDGFIGDIPNIDGIVARANFDAYVDQKLFIHNLGHAITAYIGFLIEPENIYIWNAITNDIVRGIVEASMWESAHALISEYPTEFDEPSQQKYIDDLINRFGNAHLGDTVFRVGRDIRRKLGYDERLIGSARMDMKNKITPRFTALGIASAFMFNAVDEKGKMFDDDAKFIEELKQNGLDYMLKNACGLDTNINDQKELIILIKHAYGLIEAWDSNIAHHIRWQ